MQAQSLSHVQLFVILCPWDSSVKNTRREKEDYQKGFSFPPPAVIYSDQSKSVLAWKERGHTGREVEITMRELLEVTDIFIILIVVIFSLCAHMSKLIKWYSLNMCGLGTSLLVCASNAGCLGQGNRSHMLQLKPGAAKIHK